MCDHPNREEAMVVVARDKDGKPEVWCDPCLVPIITALYTAGIRTVASCCGHGRRPGSICLADGREILITTFDEARRIDHLWPEINTKPKQPKRVQLGDKAPDGECVWKQMTRELYVVKVDYCDEAGEQLYAVYTMQFPYAWPRDLEGELRATGDHLTLAQVIEQSGSGLRRKET